MSLLSASLGIVVSLSGKGHPFMGVFFLLFCGLCDTFDGRVARSKKNRTNQEKKFGIQIDSLSDLVAFGVLPACIGAAMIWRSPSLSRVFDPSDDMKFRLLIKSSIFGILVLYILAALIRLAYFNVMEEERQMDSNPSRLIYTGLPVTSAALIFPIIAGLQYITTVDLTWIYITIALITGCLFISKIHIKKPTIKGIMIMVGIGFIEFIALIVVSYFRINPHIG